MPVAKKLMPRPIHGHGFGDWQGLGYNCRARSIEPDEPGRQRSMFPVLKHFRKKSGEEDS